MEKLNYQKIASLLVRQDVNKKENSIKCLFKVENSEEVIEATASLSKKNTAGDYAKNLVQRELRWSLWRFVYRLIGRQMGWGIGSYIASDLAGSAVNVASDKMEKTTERSFSDEEIKEGIITAFNSVAYRFQWIADENRWVLK